MSSHPPSSQPDQGDRLANAVEHLSKSVVAVGAGRRGSTSGTIWKAGIVVTTAHAVHPDRPVRLLAEGHQECSGTVLGIDHATDLAVVRTEPELQTPLQPTVATPIRTGSFVFAAARDRAGLCSASFGYVGMSHGPWQTWRGGLIERLIRLDGGLYPGFAGGPIGTTAGELIGIASAALARGFGMVIPSETVSRVSADLVAHGRVARAFLGVVTQMAQFPEPILAEHSLSGDAGLLITSVGSGSPAEKGGLLIGDLLLQFGGIRLESNEDLQSALLSQVAGAVVTLLVGRGGKVLTVELVLGERPQRRCH